MRTADVNQGGLFIAWPFAKPLGFLSCVGLRHCIGAPEFNGASGKSLSSEANKWPAGQEVTGQVRQTAFSIPARVRQVKNSDAHWVGAERLELAGHLAEVDGRLELDKEDSATAAVERVVVRAHRFRDAKLGEEYLGLLLLQEPRKSADDRDVRRMPRRRRH